MNATQSDTTDTKTARRRTPRPRAAATSTARAGYTKARALFEGRAQQWLLSRPGRLMRMPDDLVAVTALGVPCQACGVLVYRHYDDKGHSVEWKRELRGGHWAAGITAACSR